MSIGYNHTGRHAEVVALSKLWPSNRIGTVVFSLRFRKNGELALARPCSECMKFIHQSGVKTVYYSDAQGNINMERP